LNRYEIRIEWSGSFSLESVIEKMNNAGSLPDYEGEDYGLYQIYGKHILCGPDTLLYIGEATEQNNNVGISTPPESPNNIRLIHNSKRYRLEQGDNPLKDF